MKVQFVLIGLLVASRLSAQCDIAMFEKLRVPPDGFSVLKRYSVPIRELPNTPFAVQYSYVLTKQTRYGFFLKQTDGPRKPIAFIVTNSQEQVVDLDTLQHFGAEGVLMEYTPDKTDIYYLNLYSGESKKGCVSLQLSFHRVETILDSDETSSAVQKKFPKISALEGEQLKTFGITANSTSRYAFAFTRHKLYGVHLPDMVSADDLKIAVTAYSGKKVSGKMLMRPDGLVYMFRPDDTELYYLDFSNSNPSNRIVARLITIFDDKPE